MSALPAGYELTETVDPVAAHAFLARSYWSPGIPLETVRMALANSIAFAVRHAGAQVAMARVVTDRATFAYLADVYVLEEHRGRGLSKALMAAVHGHPELQGLRRWVLFTLDAHGAYEPFGWEPLGHPERGMEILDPEVYLR